MAAIAPAHALERSVVTSALTGVAISGYDPVAYFTEDAAIQGSPAFTFEWSGVVWYFASAANRDVFADSPDAYAPLFGGHCAMAMARGYFSNGNPQIFRLTGGRLMLFYSIGNRAAFDMAPADALAAAAANWNDGPQRSAGAASISWEQRPVTGRHGVAPSHLRCKVLRY